MNMTENWNALVLNLGSLIFRSRVRLVSLKGEIVGWRWEFEMKAPNVLKWLQEQKNPAVLTLGEQYLLS